MHAQQNRNQAESDVDRIMSPTNILPSNSERARAANPADDVSVDVQEEENIEGILSDTSDLLSPRRQQSKNATSSSVRESSCSSASARTLVEATDNLINSAKTVSFTSIDMEENGSHFLQPQQNSQSFGEGYKENMLM